MKLKNLLVAGLLAAGATAAFAENITQSVALVPSAGAPGSFSAGWGITHMSAGAFTDTFTFTGGGSSGQVSSALVSIGFSPNTNINFTSASINGRSFAITSGTTDLATLDLGSFTGPLVLTVTGVAAPTLAAGTSIAASYAGTANVSPVPEMQTLAMMLAGLGVIGTVGRRRMTANKA
jgi:opacity protein-like surface antigen